ncbi:unnamed protein product [Lactuca saligna]|uniref:Uncharacterized protein n=1 Tax=Lactuca saligna TaxID=75948 RepID=A0AA35YY30_LACSI|nr:unnamed protein product [Lactuca saligna]
MWLLRLSGVTRQIPSSNSLSSLEHRPPHSLGGSPLEARHCVGEKREKMRNEYDDWSILGPVCLRQICKATAVTGFTAASDCFVYVVFVSGSFFAFSIFYCWPLFPPALPSPLAVNPLVHICIPTTKETEQCSDFCKPISELIWS